MEYGLVPQEQWSAFRNIGYATAEIRKRCDALVALLSAITGSDTILGKQAIEIAPTDEAGITSIKTPVGNARFVLSWEAVGGELMGMMLLERERQDEYGRQYWEHVWSLRMPQYDNPSLGASENALSIPLDDPYSFRRGSALFAVLMSVLYGITNGATIAK